MRRFLLMALLLIGTLPGCRGELPSRAATDPATLSDADLLAVGERVYRDGRLADGSPVKALVMGNIPVDGTQVTCLNCHRRSGMGGAEGTKFVLPTNGPALYSAREKIYRQRPAYNDESLVRVLRRGVDPAGNPLDPVMPVYDLPALEMAGLIAYLKGLSREHSPGLTETSIHLATVVGADADPAVSQAMLEVLERFFRDKNGRTRTELRRKAAGPYYHDYKNKAYKQWVLHRWELTGPAATWRAQLEEHYRRQPVFALVSGLVAGDWLPIHRFCEEKQIPQLLPNTDRPQVAGKADFYTLYFSKGLALEAEVMLAHLAAASAGGRILQLFREGSAGAYAARALRRAAAAYPQFQVEDWRLPQGAAMVAPTAEVERLATVAWLERLDADGLQDETGQPGVLYLSSALLGSGLSELSGTYPGPAFLVHRFNLPEEHEDRFKRTEIWFKTRQIPLNQARIQGQTFYACMILGEGLMHIKRYFYRDYLLDVLDHGDRMAIYANNYPRLSFGPEQRYLAKGAYVIDLSRQGEGNIAGRADWIVP